MSNTIKTCKTCIILYIKPLEYLCCCCEASIPGLSCSPILSRIIFSSSSFGIGGASGAKIECGVLYELDRNSMKTMSLFPIAYKVRIIELMMLIMSLPVKMMVRCGGRSWSWILSIDVPHNSFQSFSIAFDPRGIPISA